ncbi:hypothetical protein DEVEQU_01934 [Devosia equisanguinis]|uniref:Uncharacterized protein n=1 Tax=Devosia equisanguinis TaxID=2490941 RepID=A0A447IBM0_9HYPH|nr:hypothetical protein [Devosia equisanguinis]VDS04794.1 hypothetical protein DEVEQU_01934 [Devosia equisanguinis]
MLDDQLAIGTEIDAGLVGQEQGSKAVFACGDIVVEHQHVIDEQVAACCIALDGDRPVNADGLADGDGSEGPPANEARGAYCQ